MNLAYRSSFIVLTILLFLPTNSSCQQILTNDNGEKIIVYEDGSWDFYKASPKDSLQNTSIVQPEPALSANEQLKKEVQKLLNEANITKSSLERDYTLCITDRVALEEKLELLYKDKKITPPLTIHNVEQELKDKIEEEKNIQKALEVENRKVESLEEAFEIHEKKPQKAFALIEKMGYQLTFSKSDFESNAPIGSSQNTDPFSSAPQKKYASYDPKDDIILNPPKMDCQYQFDGRDEITGKKRRDVQTQLFFAFTPPSLANHLQEADYLKCIGHLTQISGGFQFLNLEFIIKSPNAQKAFGGLNHNSLLNIKLLNGDNIRLLNNKANLGTYDPIRRAYIFKGQFPISGRQSKILSKAEIDKVRVVWDTGYEDYEIYELDFFKNQFECLFNK